MAIEEGVEGMKEFFLRPLLAAEKLNVVDLVVRTDYKTFEVVTRVESENASRRFGLAPRFMDLLRRSVLVFCQKTRNAGREREFNLPRFAQGRDNRGL